MAHSVIPDSEVRPDVLPTDRLLTNGMCRPDLRTPLRRISDSRNLITVASLWVMAGAIIAAAVWLNNPLSYIAAFILMGPVQVRFAIIMHESAHKLLLTNKKLNDWIGAWLVAYPAVVPIGFYRLGHMAHHRKEFGPDEPDIAFYTGYPCERSTLLRRLRRDALGISGWKFMKALARSTRIPEARPVVLRIIGVQLAIWAAMWAATGRWWIYPLLWWGPWMTQWRVLNRLRSIAEHGGLAASNDRRATTHSVRQSWAARLWLVPYNTGWHLAHHVDMGIPWRNLPKFHRELVDAGYVTDALVYPSYFALWKALSSN